MANMAPLFRLLVVMTSLVAISNAAKVTFYEHANWEGKSLQMEFEGLACFNLPGYFNDQTSSVNTHDNCILAFEHGDCGGRVERIAPGTPSHANLGERNFNDMISSFRQCPPNENTCRRVTINMDTSEATDLNDFGRRVKQALEEWYPLLCRLLWSPTFEEIGAIDIKITPSHDGVAGADAFGKRITGNARYYRNHQDDIGSMIHEMAHVLQKYRGGCDFMTEGIAEVARRWYYESPRPGKPSAGSRYPEPPVYFLNWVDQRWPNTIYWMNKACREGNYQKSLWNRYTGNNPEDLWDQMMRS